MLSTEQAVLPVSVIVALTAAFQGKPKVKPTSVNFHFTRQCNYSCKFCFHTATTSTKLPIESAKHGIKLLQEAGMLKINFAGGEPFLYPRYLGQLCQFSKSLGLAVSIITNGSKVTKKWLKDWGEYVDILGVSCDSFDSGTNQMIGRGEGEKIHAEKVFEIAEWCREFQIKFKLNTVVCRYNVDEDMNDALVKLNPYRWKVFQMLILEGENSGGSDKRDARNLVITNDEYQNFLDRHKERKPVVEDNKVMKDSYLMVDEEMRFLDCGDGGKRPGPSILEVGVEEAMKYIVWSKDDFIKRGGMYEWKKEGGRKIRAVWRSTIL
ncbi:radical SAM domain-containing protein [Paraphysoderma sedebokerense]|nr:radical SAM domain-containing protein [Paraphysoderma sedebokerense]